MSHVALITRGQSILFMFLQICGAEPRQKLGRILVVNGVLKLKLPKNHFNKKYAPTLRSLLNELAHLIET